MILPPGRHVLELDASAPLGYHLHLLSSCAFTLGTEEEILPLLASESLRFKEFGVAFLRRLLNFLSTFAEVGAENPPPEPKEEVELCEKCSQRELCQCVCVKRKQVWDYTDWEKIPARYAFALKDVYEYISPPICCDGNGGRSSVGGGGGGCSGDDGCHAGDCCRGRCNVNFDQKWDSMLRGFYSLARRVLPAVQQTPEMISALRAAFLDLTSETIFPVEAYRPPKKTTTSVINVKMVEVESVEAEEQEGKEESSARASHDEQTKKTAALGIQKSIKGT